MPLIPPVLTQHAPAEMWLICERSKGKRVKEILAEGVCWQIPEPQIKVSQVNLSANKIGFCVIATHPTLLYIRYMICFFFSPLWLKMSSHKASPSPPLTPAANLSLCTLGGQSQEKHMMKTKQKKLPQVHSFISTEFIVLASGWMNKKMCLFLVCFPHMNYKPSRCFFVVVVVVLWVFYMRDACNFVHPKERHLKWNLMGLFVLCFQRSAQF